MSGHTPGPWRLKGFGSIFGADGGLVATTGYRVTVGSDEDDLNARLISAAPQLLGALQDAREIIDDVLSDLRALGRLTNKTEERCRVFLAASPPRAPRPAP